MDPFGRIRVQRREEDQQLVSILANYLESVLGSRRLAQSGIVVHYMGLAVNFTSILPLIITIDSSINGIGVQRSAGAGPSGLNTKSVVDCLLMAYYVPLTLAGSPGHFGRLTVVNDGDDQHCNFGIYAQCYRALYAI